MGDSKPKRSLSKLGKLFSLAPKDDDAPKEDELERRAREEQLKTIRKGIYNLNTKNHAEGSSGGGGGGGSTTGSVSGMSTPTTPSGDIFVVSPTRTPSSQSPLDGAKLSLSPRTSNGGGAGAGAGAGANAHFRAPIAGGKGPGAGDHDLIAPQPHPVIRSQPVSRASSVLRKPSSSGGGTTTTTTTTNGSATPGSASTGTGAAAATAAGATAISSGGNSSSSSAHNVSASNASISRSSSTKQPQHANNSHTNLGLSAPGNQAMNNKPRFRMLENGSHEHNLRSAKRQEKLSNMLKDLLGAKKLRDEAKSEVSNILHSSSAAGGASASASTSAADQARPPTLFAGLVSQVKNNTSPYHGAVSSKADATEDCRSFVEKYGRCQEVIGKGSFGVVRVSHKREANSNEEVLYAVKEFKRKPQESDQKYNRRLTSEFCISSSLKHINIIDTLDLLKDAKGDYCEVMEFCSGGDLYTLIIASGKLEYAEADCFFKQLIRGVNYMHDMGVAHKDLKPENLLLSQRGVLKITDFGNSECFKMAWEHEVQLSEGISGSSPYIAPEEFTSPQFDPRGVDIWACGVIYMAMRTGRQLWKLADSKKDEFFREYLLKRKDASGYEPIESLKRARCRNVIYSILDPKPERRINGKQILNSEWGREIKVCAAGDGSE